MATFAFTLSGYKKSDNTEAIRIRVTVGDDVQYHPSGFAVLAKDWDKNKEKVKSSHVNAAAINEALIIMSDDLERAHAELIIERIPVSARAIINKSFTSLDFYDIVKVHMDQIDVVPTLKKYEALLGKLKAFRPVLSVRDITGDFIEDFRKYLKTNGGRNDKPNAHNTIIKHLNSLKSIINNSKHFKHSNPFEDVRVGTYRKSNKAKLTLEEIEKMETYLPTDYWDKIAKDIFLFCFYEAGMRIGDAMEMKWEYVTKDRILYDPHKVSTSTGIDLSIPLHKKVIKILKDYDRSTDTVFNILHEKDKTKRYDQYRKCLIMINRELKKIMLRLGIPKDISTHSARHSFAEAAKKASGMDVYSIQQSLGHSKIATTENYLGKDQSAIDDLLKKVYK